MVSIDRHEQLELIHGRGWLDRLTDDCYAKVMRGEPCEEEFDDEMVMVIDALCALLECDLVQWVDYYLLPRNPLRFVSKWRATQKAVFLRMLG